MSMRLRPCLEPRCGELVYGVRCAKHQAERRREQASRNKRFYDTPRWKALRRKVLSRDRYTCRDCGRFGNEVDHIVRIEDGGARYDESNLQTLCKPCHSRKTAKEVWHGEH